MGIAQWPNEVKNEGENGKQKEGKIRKEVDGKSYHHRFCRQLEDRGQNSGRISGRLQWNLQLTIRSLGEYLIFWHHHVGMLVVRVL